MGSEQINLRKAVLSEEERNILILIAQHPGDNHLTNEEISQRLGIPINRVKALIHKASLKMGAGNRDEVVYKAMTLGLIKLNEVLSLEELPEMLCSVDPSVLRVIADLIRKDQLQTPLPENLKNINKYLNRKKASILTNRERDVLILAGRGFNNQEIADELCLSSSAIRTFLNRAFTKLGARKRADAVQAAMKKGEISVGEMMSPEEFIHFIAPTGAETIEKVAQMLEKNLEQEAASNENYRSSQTWPDPAQNRCADQLMKLTDEQWYLIKPLIPEEQPRANSGKRQTKLNNRSVLDGILWVLRNGAAWQDLPDRYPSPAACQRRFLEWKRTGVLEQILTQLADDLKERGLLDLTELLIVGTYVVSRKRERTREKPGGARAPRTWQWQTALIFLSPYTRHLLRGMKSPLWERLSQLDS